MCAHLRRGFVVVPCERGNWLAVAASYPLPSLSCREIRRSPVTSHGASSLRIVCSWRAATQSVMIVKAEWRPSLPLPGCHLPHWPAPGVPSGPSGAWGLGPGTPGGLSGAGGLGSGATDGLSGAWGLGDPVSPFFGSRVSAGPAGLGSVLGGDFGEPIGSLAGSGVIAELLTVSSG